MATIIALPTAASAPVVQQPRRGRLPRVVTSLTAVRQERQQEHDALLVAYKKRSEAACFAVLRRIMDGKTTGIAIIEACPGGADVLTVGGEFQDKPEWLQNALYASSDTCDRDMLSKQKR